MQQALKGSLHEHFIPYKNAFLRRQQLRSFWKKIEKLGWDFIAVTTRSDFVGLGSPENVFGVLESSMPDALKKRGFKLIPAMEIRSKEKAHLNVYSDDPKKLFSVKEFLECFAGNELPMERLLQIAEQHGFLPVFPHPERIYGIKYSLEQEFKRKGIKDFSQRAAEKTIELISKYSVGLEAHNGSFYDLKNLVKSNVFRKNFFKWLLKPQISSLSSAKTFHTAGQDSHIQRNIGRTEIRFSSGKPNAVVSLKELFSIIRKNKAEISRKRRFAPVSFFADFFVGAYRAKKVRRKPVVHKPHKQI